MRTSLSASFDSARARDGLPASIATAPPESTAPVERRKIRLEAGNTRSFAYAKKDIAISLEVPALGGRRVGFEPRHHRLGDAIAALAREMECIARREIEVP